MKKNDSLIGIFMILFSVVGIVYVQMTDKKSLVGLSPGAFPTFLLVILLICSIGILVESLKSKKVTKIHINWKKVIPTIVALVLYIIAFQFLGFIISTILFLVVALLLFEEKRLKILLTVPVITSLSIYFIFTILFRIPLP